MAGVSLHAGQKGKNDRDPVIGPQQIARVDVSPTECQALVSHRDGSVAESLTIPEK